MSETAAEPTPEADEKPQDNIPLDDPANATVQPFPVPTTALVQAATIDGQKAGVFQAATPVGMVVLFFDEDACRALSKMFAEAAGDRGGLVVASSLPKSLAEKNK